MREGGAELRCLQGGGLPQTAGRMVEGTPSPRGGQGPHFWDIYLLPYFQDRISVYFCVKYEHLKLTTNTCRPVWAFRLCHHHITASTAQGQVISPPDLSTRRGQPPHERSPESLKGHGQSDKPKAPNGWRGRQVGSTLLSVTCQFLGSHLETQRNFSEYLPSR